MYNFRQFTESCDTINDMGLNGSVLFQLVRKREISQRYRYYNSYFFFIDENLHLQLQVVRGTTSSIKSKK